MTVVKVWMAARRLPCRRTSPAATLIPAALFGKLCDHLCINSTAVITVNKKGLKVGGAALREVHARNTHPTHLPPPSILQEIRGSKTEGAGLLLVEAFGIVPQALRDAAAPEQQQRANSSGSFQASTAPRIVKQVRDARRRCSHPCCAHPPSRCAPAPPRTVRLLFRPQDDGACQHCGWLPSQQRGLTSPIARCSPPIVELSRGGPVRVYTTGGSDFILAISGQIERVASGEAEGVAS